MKQRQAQSGLSIQHLYAEKGIYLALDSVPRDVDTGVNRMNQYLNVNRATGRPYWQISDCPNLVKEMQQLHWAYYASGKIADENNVKETIHKKDDHAPDSARYFFTFLPDLSAEGLGLLQEQPVGSGLKVGTIWDYMNNHTGQFVDGGSQWSVVSSFSALNDDNWSEDDVA